MPGTKADFGLIIDVKMENDIHGHNAPSLIPHAKY